jgi:putative salt-induced outer membrane protein YdiY
VGIPQFAMNEHFAFRIELGASYTNLSHETLLASNHFVSVSA